ncbi:MAG: four helix bundle protein [Parcubacteria group bacterium CG10_big_fil_rev_8_21_14_0_10_36_14]|nr:MAG: four helix bundle protein [Parcubacteria group bacterium CG10_big_fil_rev_8_21_14_0_10_36_14]
MNQESRRIRSFTNLFAWQEGQKLVLMIYGITKSFPQKESLCLTSQMNRCAVSITSNIAEGFSRETHKDKLRFYFIALGSTTELQNQLLISRDIKYIDKNEFNLIAEKTVKVHKIINGLIKKTKEMIPNS